VVKRLLAKEKIAGPNPVSRSEQWLMRLRSSIGHLFDGDVAKWQGKGLQNPHRGFNSRRRLKLKTICFARGRSFLLSIKSNDAALSNTTSSSALD
jgi:hypothetical protein